ncbi:hypothetical protein CU103_28195 [Phyllobacterium sophorae]|uniref:Uncharacterized protein n=1 Tax=Phyllobacterium sophorae TaxID=1520277 RepID=A0A2P7ATB4_9HYPH|nr:hypothetical protein CU103_28195 [Phyllobacterium sophorae]
MPVLRFCRQYRGIAEKAPDLVETAKEFSADKPWRETGLLMVWAKVSLCRIFNMQLLSQGNA